MHTNIVIRCYKVKITKFILIKFNVYIYLLLILLFQKKKLLFIIVHYIQSHNIPTKHNNNFLLYNVNLYTIDYDWIWMDKENFINKIW